LPGYEQRSWRMNCDSPARSKRLPNPQLSPSVSPPCSALNAE
jgi:hypothetical protein